MVSMRGTHSRQAAPGDPAQPYRHEFYVPAGNASPQSIAAAPRKNSSSVWKTNVLWASARVKSFIV